LSDLSPTVKYNKATENRVLNAIRAFDNAIDKEAIMELGDKKFDDLMREAEKI